LNASVLSRESRLARLRPVLRSPALWSALTFGAGGVGFAAGNILLARVLPEVEYGRVALFLALTQLGIVMGPVGLETVINRHHLSASRGLLSRVAVTSAVVGVGLAAVSWAFYGFGIALAIALALTVLAAATNRTAGSFFQSRRKFGTSLFLILIHNWIVLIAVPVVLFSGRPEAVPAALTIAGGYLMTAVIGWRKGFEMRRATEAPPATISSSTLIQEGVAAMGLQIAVGAFFQLDRLIIPNALSIRDLAVYSVVSSIAASPFRMLQTGVGFALLPRLKACETRAAVMRLIRHEMFVMTGISVLAAIGVLLFTPWLLGVVLKSRYAFPMSLLYAMVVVGFVRVAGGISGAIVSALGSARQLALLNVFSWVSLGIAVIGAFAARSGGLTGVVYGIGAGWLALALAGTVIGLRAVGARDVVAGAPR
jgi:O-antigen/teichoic acid export membrane protein